MGDDASVHGDQSYVISYTIPDVMHATDTVHEFYWDLVPVDRAQRIHRDDMSEPRSADSIPAELNPLLACGLISGTQAPIVATL